MPVGVLIMMPGASQEMYEQVTEKMFGQAPFDPADAPEGMILHTAGPVPDGWYVYDVWESKEQFQRFAQERVGPAMQEISGGQMRGPDPQFFEIANLVKAGGA
ncbi:MAG: hypothetical protein V7644_1384 [Actinomycetota bacterium]|jgi:hypothetical protein